MSNVLRVRVPKRKGSMGLPCHFRDRDKLECHIPPDEGVRKNFVCNPESSKGVQACTQMALSLCNTENVEYVSKGIQHTEGGWPKDVNKNDSEQVQRFRKKIERDDNYTRQVLGLAQAMEHVVLQNNALNVYECFFEDLEPIGAAGQCDARTVMVAKDSTGEHRPVKRLSWAPDGQAMIVAAYSHSGAEGSNFSCPDAFIWDTRSPNEPLAVLKAWSPINCVTYRSKDFNSMIGGLVSGQVGQWDARVGRDAVALSEREVSHRDCVTDILWLTSKKNTEFLSGASDGQVLTWDIRNIHAPIDEPLIMDPEKTNEPRLDRAEGVTQLEFEATIPTRFMVGTERGHIFSCNRKGKTPMERLPFKYNAHFGPIYAVERNPAVTKIFLTIGDWQAKVWSEECRESAIIWTKLHKVNLYCGAWSRTRFTLFFVGREDGVIDGWDLLLDQHEPVISVKLCDEPLISLVVHENGENVAVGAIDGTIYVIKVSQFLVENAKNDKAFFTEMLERESRRQKVTEAKIKEMKLKNKTARDDDEEARPSARIEVASTDEPLINAIALAEKNFFENIDTENERRTRKAESRFGIKRPVVRIDENAGMSEGEEKSPPENELQTPVDDKSLENSNGLLNCNDALTLNEHDMTTSLQSPSIGSHSVVSL